MSQTSSEQDNTSGTWPPSPTLKTADPPKKAPSLVGSLFFIGYAAFVTTFAQDKVLGSLPIRLWLKNDLHCSRTQVATFLFWSGLAWYIKPLFGLITDAFPLFGTRRRWYMIFSSLLAAGAWVLLSAERAHYATFLGSAILLGVMMVVASTIMGALLVEAGQKYHATGRVSAVREFVQDGCFIIVGPISGFLAEHTFGITAGIGAAVLATLAAATFLMLKEPPAAQRNTSVWRDAGRQLGVVFRSPTLWAAAGLIVLYFFSPGFQTPLLYRQTDLLHFDDIFIGTLATAGGIGSVLAALVYGVICRKISLRPLLFIGVVTTATGSLFYLGYHPTKLMAEAIEFGNGFLGIFGALTLYDLATRGTPRGGEGMGYALMMSARNVALFGADVVGSKLLDTYHLAWDALVWLNAGTTLICLVVIPFLPRTLMRHKDGEDIGDSQATGEQISGAEPVPRVP